MDGGATEIVGGGPVEDLGGLERWWNDPGIAVWSFVLFGCFLLNATLLLAFLVRPGLRTISNRFVMNLTVSNLLTCVILNPLLIMDAPSPSSSTSANGGSICAISEGATALVTTSSVLSVFLIAVDQYFAVVDPLRYRARVNKFKSGMLIVSVWLISMTFGLLASFNPNPRSVWLSCMLQNVPPGDGNASGTTSSTSLLSSTLTVNISSDLSEFLSNKTTDLLEEISMISNDLEAVETDVEMDGTIGFIENATSSLGTLADGSISYGLVYAIVQSVLAYLLPFAGVCWIYISIYSAAHRNSERTRRTGSRPVLSSSASFCEEQYATARQQQQQQQQMLQQEVLVEDFRRIPKISSLSSIDETSETTQPSNHAIRGRSHSSSSDILRASSVPADDRPSSDVVFTVGSQRIEVTRQPAEEWKGDDDDRREDRVPAATLKAEFLEKDNGADYAVYEDLVRSKFHDRPDQRRKSSHDLMYEEMLTRANASSDGDTGQAWIAGDSTDDNSTDSEDEIRSRNFDTLEVPGMIPAMHRAEAEHILLYPSYVYESSPTRDCSNVMNQTITYESDKTTEKSSGIKESDLPRKVMENGSYVATDLDEERSQRYCPTDESSTRRSSDALGTSDIIVDMTIDGTGGPVRDIATSNTATESSACLLTPIVTITPAPNRNGNTLQRVSSVRSTSSYINSLKHRISNGSLFRYREETRAARISALVIVMGLICWSPYMILLVVKNLPNYSDLNLPHEYDVLALSLLILAAYVSPLLFGYRSRRVKRELRKFFCFRRELSYKNNRSLMAKKVLKRRHSSTLSHLEMDHKYNIFNCVYGRSRWPKEKVQFVQVPDTALAVETCRSSFSSGASTQISSTSTEEC